MSEQKLDASIERIIQHMNSPFDGSVSPKELRESYRQGREKVAPKLEDVANVMDFDVPSSQGDIPVRLYRGTGTLEQLKLPCLIYFHGGGWVVGSINTHDYICRRIANQASCIVISVDYKLSPEHKFPAAVNDSFETLKHIISKGESLYIDQTRLSLAGDSAGGNLAFVTALLARDHNINIKYQALIYPVTDLHLSSEMYDVLGDKYLLSREVMSYYINHYLEKESDKNDWRASPVFAKDVSKLPPTLVITAGCDPLCDEGAKLVERLRGAKVDVTFKEFSGQIHGFVAMGGVVPEAFEAIDEIVEGIKRYV